MATLSSVRTKWCGATFVCLLVWLAVPSASGQAGNKQPKVSPAPGVSDVTRGQSVTIQGENFPEQETIQVHIRTGKEKEGGEPRLVPAKRVDANSLTFDSKDLEPGRYLLAVRIGDKPELPVPGELRVLPDAVKLLSIYPTRLRPRGDGRFNFEVAGENLGRRAEDNVLEVVGRGAVITQACKGEADTGPCLKVDGGAAGRKLAVIGFPSDGETKASILISSGDRLSQPMAVEFLRLNRWQVRLWSLVVMGLLLGFIALLVASGLKKITEGAKSRWDVLFLDKQTNSYSLSKFQLLFWIVVTALGYIYVFLCRTLVQGELSSFPPIPENLPEMLAVSGGTAVTVAGVAATRGAKGAGPLEPTAADFITAGGLVVGERFQFFLWTLVAGFGFLALLFLANPTQVKELPKVPDTLLYLTGVSAAAYVGGRLVRKRGPVIKNLTFKATPDKMEFDLYGEGLSKSGTVKIDDKLMRAGLVTLKSNPSESPEEFCDKLKITVENPGRELDAYLEGEHTLTLTNPDGQSAAAKFPIDPMTIESIDASSVPWVVKGQNFVDETKVEKLLKVEKLAEVTLEKKDVKRIDATKLEVTLSPPPPKGEYTLVLKSPSGLRASKKVTIS